MFQATTETTRPHLNYGLNVTDLCTTKNGRIFYSAEADLYELVYERRIFGGGLSCSKTNHSKGLIDYLMPVLSIFHSKDEIRQIAVDDSRNLLFVLFKRGSIQLFDMGEDGLSLKKHSIFYREELEHIAREFYNVSSELFYELVQITPISKEQSLTVNLIATTSKGVRVYFSCYNEGMKMERQLDFRPKTFRVIHTRFPPNIRSDDSISQDIQIYYTSISVDSALMASAPDGNDTNLWVLNSSVFALSSTYSEFTTATKIRGTVWKIARLKQSTIGLEHQRDYVTSEMLSNDMPLIFIQHICPVEKVFILTSLGIYVYQIFSPLEIFRQVLHNFGNDTKQFGAFARTIDPVELCVMALGVLCSESSMDSEIKDMALRVFISYGGEPARFSLTDDAGQSHLDGSVYKDIWEHASSRNGHSLGILSSKTPLRASTPREYLNGTSNGHSIDIQTPGSIADDHSIVAGAQIHNSPRYDSLFTYFVRIVKSFWKRTLCFATDNIVYSNLTNEEMETVKQLLSSFAHVIDNYSLISATNPQQYSSSYLNLSSTPKNSHKLSSDLGSLMEQERHALQRFRALVGATLELLSLWNILLEHELNAIFKLLNPNTQSALINYPLEAIVRSRTEICAELIPSLMRFYIGDDATTTAISERLRQQCPSLFTTDDASVIKATENIHRAKTSPESRLELISESISAFKKSIHRLNLTQACDLFVQVLNFEAIVDLVLTRAQKDDPNDLALVVYKKRAPLEGPMGDAFRKRNEAYDVFIDLLRLLHTVAVAKNRATLPAIATSASIFPSASIINQLSAANATNERNKIINNIIFSDDELANVALFRWMMANNMSSCLIENKCKFFEGFLFYEMETNPPKGNQCLELLWKFYEKSENYLDAAKVLTDMASKFSKIQISQRITYLSQALICIRSAAETKSNIELKQDIQDKLDVAQIQLKAKSIVESSCDINQTEAISVKELLNFQLCDLTQLFKIAKQFDLAEVKLAILHCAGKYDEVRVIEIWKELLNRGSVATFLHHQNLFRLVLLLSALFEQVTKSILREILVFCLAQSPPMDWLFSLCKEAMIPLSILVKVLTDLRTTDPFWSRNQQALKYIMEIIEYLVGPCKNQTELLSGSEKKALRQMILALLASLQLNIHVQSDQQRLELIQAQVNQIS